MKPRDRKIELKFMDVSVKLTGCRQVESRALGLLADLIESRIQMYQLEVDQPEDDEPGIQRKSKRLIPDTTFMQAYA